MIRRTDPVIPSTDKSITNNDEKTIITILLFKDFHPLFF